MSRLRLAVLSDVHGNLPALEAVLRDAWRGQVPDGVIVAGDHIMGAPYPVEVLDRLRDLGATLIAGNRDRWLLRAYHGCPPAGWEAGQHCGTGRWTLAQLDEDRRRALDALPEQTVLHVDGSAPIRVVHGSLDNVAGRILPDRQPAVVRRFQLNHGRPAAAHSADEVLAAIPEPVLICGHTHLQWVQQKGTRLVLNPGSVGEPLQGDPLARYAMLTWDGAAWSADLRAVPYDISVLGPAFAERGLLEEGGGFARATLRDMESGRNFTTHFFRHVARRAERCGVDPRGVIPDEVWQAAAADFDWEGGAP